MLAPPFKPPSRKKQRGPGGRAQAAGSVEAMYAAQVEAMASGWEEDDWALAMRELDGLHDIIERDGVMADESLYADFAGAVQLTCNYSAQTGGSQERRGRPEMNRRVSRHTAFPLRR